MLPFKLSFVAVASHWKIRNIIELQLEDITNQIGCDVSANTAIQVKREQEEPDPLYVSQKTLLFHYHVIKS